MIISIKNALIIKAFFCTKYFICVFIFMRCLYGIGWPEDS